MEIFDAICNLPDLDTCFRWCKEPERPRTRGLYPCIKSNKLIDWHQIAQPPLPSPSANKLGLFELFVAFPLEHPGFSNKGDCDAAWGQVDESSATQICWLVLCGKNFQPVLGGWFSSSLQPLLPPEEKSTSALLSRLTIHLCTWKGGIGGQHHSLSQLKVDIGLVSPLSEPARTLDSCIPASRPLVHIFLKHCLAELMSRWSSTC